MTIHTYKGLLPDTSCNGIEYQLTIRNHEHSGDGTFSLTLTRQKIGNGKNSVSTYNGKRFTQRGTPEDDNATVWQCISDDGSQIFNFLRENDDTLTLLNYKFEKPQTNQNYSLTRVE